MAPNHSIELTPSSKPRFPPATAHVNLATHSPGIEVVPFVFPGKVGSGLYGTPLLALVVETLYGIFCWRVFRGSRAMLAVIVGFNLGALSFYAPSVPGPESLLAGHPKAFALVILVHIVAALLAVLHFARKDLQRRPSSRPFHRAHSCSRLCRLAPPAHVKRQVSK